MVDKETTPGSITEAADSSQERVAEISNVSHTISEMQRKVNQQVDETKQNMGDLKGIEDVQNSMNGVLSNLNRTVGAIGQGFAKVATSTAKASGDLVRGYGKAISEDISYNKQNVIAMAMARSTPLFGYFAAKFVETDVFQKAKERMKQSLGDALGSVTTKFKDSFTSLFEKLKLKKSDKTVSGLTNKTGKVPKMQHGGYVEKGGIAKLHAAEVVMPIETVLEKVDASIAITKELATITKKAQLNTLSKMSAYVADTREMQKVGIFKGFLRALKNTQTQYEQPAQLRMLRAVLSIQDSLGATIGTWPQVWQKMLVQHPTLRQLVFFTKSLYKGLAAPFKWVYAVFKARGGYAGHLSKSKNPMVAAAENIGLVYSEGMWRLDNIAKFTRATAEATRDLSSAVTGKKYPQLEGVPTGIWSIMSMGKKLLVGSSKLIFHSVLTAFNKQEIAGKLLSSYEQASERIYQKVLRILPSGKEMQGIYGTGGTLEGKSGKTAFGVPLIKGAIPVSEIHVEERFKEIKGYMLDNKKKETKLLGYNKNMNKTLEAEYKVTKRMDDREKRRTITGMFGGIFGGAKSLFSGLGGVFQSIMGLFGGGAGGVMKSPLAMKALLTAVGIGVTSHFWDKWSAKDKEKLKDGSIFRLGITDAIRTILPPAGFVLDMFGATKSAIWQAFKDKLTGKDVNLTTMIAKIVKDAIWSFLHIDEDLAKVKRWGTKAKELTSGPIDKVKKFFGIKPKTIPEQFMDYIKQGKDKFMQLNPMGYLGIAKDKLSSLRDKFMKTQKPFYGNTVQAAIDYGFKQEKAFSNYVKNLIKTYTKKAEPAVEWVKDKTKELTKKGKEYKDLAVKHDWTKWMLNKKNTLAEKGKEYTEAAQKQDWVKWIKEKKEKISDSQVTEKAIQIAKSVPQLAKEAVDEALAGTAAVIDELKESTKEKLSGMQKVGAEMGATFVNATNAVTTTVTNSQQLQDMGSAFQKYYSQYSERVMKGDVDD